MKKHVLLARRLKILRRWYILQSELQSDLQKLQSVKLLRNMHGALLTGKRVAVVPVVVWCVYGSLVAEGI